MMLNKEERQNTPLFDSEPPPSLPKDLLGLMASELLVARRNSELQPASLEQQDDTPHCSGCRIGELAKARGNKHNKSCNQPCDAEEYSRLQAKPSCDHTSRDCA